MKTLKEHLGDEVRQKNPRKIDEELGLGKQLEKRLTKTLRLNQEEEQKRATKKGKMRSLLFVREPMDGQKMQ